jgi:hypothetical protein
MSVVRKTDLFFTTKNHLNKLELKCLYTELLGKALDETIPVLDMEMITEQLEADISLKVLTSRIAELEYGLQKRTKEPRDGAQFATFWKAFEQSFFLGELIKQNEARVNFILIPQAELHVASINRIKLEIDAKNKERIKYADEEDRALQLIDKLNNKREELLEEEIGPYNFRKVSEVEIELERLGMKESCESVLQIQKDLERLFRSLEEFKETRRYIKERVNLSSLVRQMLFCS